MLFKEISAVAGCFMLITVHHGPSSLFLLSMVTSVFLQIFSNIIDHSSRVYLFSGCRWIMDDNEIIVFFSRGFQAVRRGQRRFHHPGRDV